MSKIVLTGGGTGGHIMPNLSLIPYLKNHFESIIYIGSKTGLESKIIPQEKGIIFEQIDAVKLDRTKVFKNFLIPFSLICSINLAKKILKQYKPDVIFSKGGYVSVPVCIAGKMLKIPIISHESDLSLGLANKLIYKFCTTFCTTFEATAKNLKKAVCTGSPIRKEIFNGNKENAYKLTKLVPTRPFVLIMGGSMGAKSLNEIIFNNINKLTEKFNVIHIVGKGNINKTINQKNYCQLEFCYNLQDVLAVSDVVITRAGSNTINELLALKKPMILVPLPKSASRGDQIENAKYFVSLGYAEMLNQETLTSETLIELLLNVYKNKEKYISNINKAKSPKNANELICNEILKTLK